MKKGLAALILGKAPEKDEESEGEEVDEHGFDVAASAVMSAIESGNKSKFKSALKDAIEICTNS